MKKRRPIRPGRAQSNRRHVASSLSTAAIAALLAIAFAVVAGCESASDPSEPPAQYSVGGTASNLPEGGIVIALNGIDLTLPQDGPFTFPTLLNDGSAYGVTIVDDGPLAVCLVSNFEGVIDGANVDDVIVGCELRLDPA